MIAVPKIILIILVVFAVWYLMRWWNRAPPKTVRRRQASPSPRPVIEDLVACRVCGAYVAAGAGCGKADCPQLR